MHSSLEALINVYLGKRAFSLSHIFYVKIKIKYLFIRMHSAFRLQKVKWLEILTFKYIIDNVIHWGFFECVFMVTSRSIFNLVMLNL